MKKNKYITIIILVLIFSSLSYKEVYSLEVSKEKKVVYLTFDDGLSPGITNEILNVLENNNVKATFFLIGNNSRANNEVIKKISNNEMSIMPHTDKQKYKNIYSSSKTYFDNLKNCEDTIFNITGKTNFNFIRMPGGSDNTIGSSTVLDEIRNKIINDGKYYIDWSLEIGGDERTENTMDFIESRIRESGGLYKVEVVLMHDLKNKVNTIEALQKTIDFYKERDYEFKTLDNIDNSEIEYLKNIKVINKK